MQYTKVTQYFRQPVFDFYKNHRDPYYAVTFSLDMTSVKAFADRHGYSTYLSLCYFFTKAMQSVEPFRYRLLKGQLVLYDRLHPSAIVPASNGSFAFARLNYDRDPHNFQRAARKVVAQAFEQDHLNNDPDHNNYIFFTTLPKIPFTGLTHVRPNENSDGQPRVSFGRFETRDDRMWVPVGMQVNHLFIDGAALGAFFECCQSRFLDPGCL